MKTVKGLVVKRVGNSIILLTGDGEFLRVPARGRSYSQGAEVEVAVPQGRRLPIFPAACVAAALVLLVAFSFLKPALSAPEAYLALDINPGVVLSLDKNAVVLEAHAINDDGQVILDLLRVDGLGALEALDALLEAARANGYLSEGRDNVVIISLAAPPDFSLDEVTLRASIARQVLSLEVDTYVKITVTGLDKVKAAKDMEIPLNALLLGEAMQEAKRPGEGRSLLEGSTISEFLQIVKPAEVFGKDEFVSGREPDDMKPDAAGPPEGTPAGGTGRDEDEDPDGAGNDKSSDMPGQPPQGPGGNPPVTPNGGTPGP